MTDVTKYIPKFRSEKTEPNRDDIRVVVAGVIGFVILITAHTFYLKIEDFFFTERPFVSASTLKIVKLPEKENPYVLYDADANQTVDGQWVASVYLFSGDIRISSRRGNGSYNDKEDEARIWSWSAFFDNEISRPPIVPNEPFYVCVRYIVDARDSGVSDESPLQCSLPYFPESPNFYFPETE